MDFSWTQEQDELYSSILTQTRRTLMKKDAYTDDEWWKREAWLRCADLDLLGLCVPKQYGGSGYNASITARVIEAFGLGCDDMGLVFSVAAHLFACAMPIAEHGQDALKHMLLPGLCNGKLIGANAITEEEAGSDIFALKTRAVRENNTYLLDGHKSYVSNGPVADLFVVYAVTDPLHGYLGISCFVIEKDTPGLYVREPISKMGLTSTPASQLTFEGCRVPSENRLGSEGNGALIFKRSMQWERSCLFAAYVGQMERQLEQTIAHAQNRSQFGRPLAANQVIAHRIADMKLRLEAARLLLYQACWLFDQGKDATLAISLSKLAISEAAVYSGLDAVHMHGSLGISPTYGIERMLRDALPSTIFSGSSEMQREIIATELGL